MIFTLLSALTVLAVFIAQLIFITYFSFHGVSVYFVLVGVSVFSIRYGPQSGAFYGFFNGIFFDAFSTRLFGFEALVFTTIGYLCGLLSRRFDETLFTVQHIVTASVCVLYFIVSQAALSVIISGGFSVNVVEAMLSTVLTVAVTRPFYKLYNWWFTRIEQWSGKANPV